MGFTYISYARLSEIIKKILSYLTKFANSINLTYSLECEKPCTFVSNFHILPTVAGTSDDPCEENYLGEKPFSELETQHIRDAFQSLKPTPVLAFSIHAALNALLHGWAYKKGALQKNKDEVVKIKYCKIKQSKFG